jgi:hypothetical protein
MQIAGCIQKPLSMSKSTSNSTNPTVPPTRSSGLLNTHIFEPVTGMGVTPGTAKALKVTATHLSLKPTQGKSTQRVLAPSPSR